MSYLNMNMFNSNNDNKTFSLANIIEEQLNNISLGGTSLGLETDTNELNLDGPEGGNFEKPETHKRNLKDADKVIEGLCPGEIRWFYKNSSKTWIELGGYDTLQLEAALRKLPPELQVPQFKGSPNKPLSPTQIFKQNGSESPQNPNIPKILVRGGLYEVDLITRTGASIYWPGTFF
jgi:hypothetical protein